MDRGMAAALATFLLLAAAQWVVALSQPVLRNSDQINIGVMVLANAQPELFSRDYLFADRSLFRFYTPAFLAAAAFLTDLTGSYKSGLALLVPVVSFVYMAGMYKLVHEVSGYRTIAFFIAIVSATQQWALGATFWGVSGLGAMLPRTVFCAATPWLALIVFRMRHPVRARTGFWFGLAIGVLANLHPVSAFHFAQLVLLLLLLAGGRQSFPGLAAAASAMVAGAFPVAISFFGNTVGRGGTVPFAQFAQALRERLATLFPFQALDVFGITVDAPAQTMLVWAYLGAIAGWTLYTMAFGSKSLRLRPWPFLLLLIVQMPIVYLLLSASRLPLVLAAFAGGTACVVRRSPSRQDWLMLGFLSLTVFLSFIVPFFLAELWERFQWAAITSLLAEQSRAAQFVYLPLYLFSARLLQLAARYSSGVRRIGLCAAAVLLVLYPVRREVIPRVASFSTQERQRLADDRDLYAWAQTRTSRDSLFYYDSLPFRLYARRSITHAWKDLGIAYYSQTRLLEFKRRFEEMQAAYPDPDGLISKARQLHADYIVVDAVRRVSLTLPVVFRNDSHTVYAVEE